MKNVPSGVSTRSIAAKGRPRRRAFSCPRCGIAGHFPANLQCGSVLELPDQPTAPVADWRTLAKPDHLIDTFPQGPSAAGTCLADIDDECSVHPFSGEPCDRNIRILPLEMATCANGKEARGRRSGTNGQVDTRAFRNCVKRTGTQFRDGTKSLEPQSLKPGYRLQLVGRANSEGQGRHHCNRDIGAARYPTRSRRIHGRSCGNAGRRRTDCGRSPGHGFDKQPPDCFC